MGFQPMVLVHQDIDRYSGQFSNERSEQERQENKIRGVPRIRVKNPCYVNTMNRITISQELHREALKAVTRRQLFRRCGTGMGAIALTSLLNENLLGATSPAPELDPLAPRAPHFAPRAKNIIYLHMAGAPSQLDLFDNKPKLTEYN